MKKEWIFASLCALATLVIALMLLRFLAPGLIGITPELELVRSSKSLPPFFDAVFREEDIKADSFILKDPRIVRAKPFLPDSATAGPHDLLGFRNRYAPHVADIVTIGDSQTYGNNAFLDETWPYLLRSKLRNRMLTLYNMAVGGWCAYHYLEIFDKALFFRPTVIIVAFYTGNDPIESFVQVYGRKECAGLRPDPDLSAKDAPNIKFPPPEKDRVPVTFSDGIRTVFTPAYRHASSKRDPVVDAGYSIMIEALGKMAQKARISRARLVVTLIPTKELVYAKKVKKDRIRVPESYEALVKDETERIDKFKKKAERLNLVYVDLLKPLQKAATGKARLYPENLNGHPVSEGYKKIADVMAAAVNPLLPGPIEGLVIAKYNKINLLFLVRDNKRWRFASRDLILKNGWKNSDIKMVGARDLVNYPYAGKIREVDLARFGP